MTSDQWIEVGKMISPILTVGLAAYLAAKYYEKNKQVDFSLKLSEKVLEEVYTPALVMIDNLPHVITMDSYKGLNIHEIDDIHDIFKKHQHLVEPKLLRMIWSLKEEFVQIIRNVDDKDWEKAVNNHLVDTDRKFFTALQKENEYHLKRIGFLKR